MTQRPAKGRGNQKDWVNLRPAIGTQPEHTAHNNQVEAKKRARRARRILKAMEVHAGE